MRAWGWQLDGSRASPWSGAIVTGIARSLIPLRPAGPARADAPHPAGRSPVAGQGTLAILNNAAVHQAHLSFQECWTLRCCLGCASPLPVCMGQHGCVQGGLHSAHCHACKLPHAALLAVLQLVLLHDSGCNSTRHAGRTCMRCAKSSSCRSSGCSFPPSSRSWCTSSTTLDVMVPAPACRLSAGSASRSS